MQNNSLKVEVIRFLFLNFGKRFTYANLVAEFPNLDRATAYEIMEELLSTGHVMRDKKHYTSGSRFLFGITDDDEEHALEIWTKYLRDSV